MSSVSKTRGVKLIPKAPVLISFYLEIEGPKSDYPLPIVLAADPTFQIG